MAPICIVETRANLPASIGTARPVLKRQSKRGYTMKQHTKMNCRISIDRIKSAVQHYRANAFEPYPLRDFISMFGEVYSAHFIREFCHCKDGMVRVRRLGTFGRWSDSID